MPGVAFAAPIAVAAAIAIVVASSGSVPIRAADALAARFGIRLPCARLTMISADGNYARVDFDRFRPCGTYGNYGTIVLRRVHRHWIREFEASGQTCRMSLVAPLVLVELKLCSPAIAQPPPGS
jgi:hypothetical protein